MKRVSSFLVLLAACLAACGPAPTPQPTLDVEATSRSLSRTMIAGTLTAQPSATPLPTDTPSPLPPTATPTSTETVTPTVTSTSIALNGTLAPEGVGNSKTALFRINNTTGQDLNITIYGVDATGNRPVYYQYGPIKYSFNFRVLWGSYNYTVQIGNKKTLTGTFRIYNYDKTTMNVYSNKVVIAGP